MGAGRGRADSGGEGGGDGADPGQSQAEPVPPVRDAGALRAGKALRRSGKSLLAH